MSQVTGSAFGFSGIDYVGSNIMKDRNREDAQIAFDRSSAYQTEMSNTAWQRGIADMKAAGINPMLAVSQGPASTPTANMPLPRSGLVSGGGNAATQYQTAAQVELANATSDKTRAEAAEIRERTPSHAVGRELTAHQSAEIRQKIGESALRIERIIAQTEHETASAENVRQQTTNLKETLGTIRETITHLKQSNAANIPEVQRQIANIERLFKQMEIPGRQTDEAYSTSPGGTVLRAIGNALRSLNPLLPSTSSHNFGSSITR